MAAINQDAPTDVVLARQPIFDADLHISAFELLYRAVGELVTVGFTLALDNFTYRPELEPLLRLAKIAKLDVQSLSPDELAQHAQRLKDWDLKIVAEKVETR